LNRCRGFWNLPWWKEFARRTFSSYTGFCETKEGWRVQTMSEFNSKVSEQILSLLEGEKIRVILRDGTVVEGAVVRVNPEELSLTNQVVPLDQIATYYVLKGD
jgi:hypothetical protein